MDLIELLHETILSFIERVGAGREKTTFDELEFLIRFFGLGGGA